RYTSADGRYNARIAGRAAAGHAPSSRPHASFDAHTVPNGSRTARAAGHVAGATGDHARPSDSHTTVGDRANADRSGDAGATGLNTTGLNATGGPYPVTSRRRGDRCDDTPSPIGNARSTGRKPDAADTAGSGCTV
ncbi:MAG: hypothetical protein WCK95_22150, partial [Alphaproteobacteria bacterium]